MVTYIKCICFYETDFSKRQNQEEDFFKFCVLFRKSEFYVRITEAATIYVSSGSSLYVGGVMKILSMSI